MPDPSCGARIDGLVPPPKKAVVAREAEESPVGATCPTGVLQVHLADGVCIEIGDASQ